jgi:hypothetical protein
MTTIRQLLREKGHKIISIGPDSTVYEAIRTMADENIGSLAMKRFADSLSRQKGIKPPPGYKTSISICRRFLQPIVKRLGNSTLSR